MSKLVVNKKFNQKYLKKSMETNMFPRDELNNDHQKIIDKKTVGRDANGDTVDNINISNYLIVTQTFINMIDKLNAIMAEDKVFAYSRFYSYLANMIFSTDESIRTRGWESLFSNGYITQAEFDSLKINNISINGQLLADSYSWTYEPINDYYLLKHSTPLKLEKRWIDKENNPDGEQLYILLPAVSSLFFNNTEKDNNYLTSTLKYMKINEEGFAEYFEQIGYFAYTLSNTQGDGEVQFDYIDSIDYIDSLELAIKLPKKYM